MGRKEEKEKRDKAERKKTALDFLRAKYDNEANSSQTSMHQNQSASPPLQTADDSMDESTDESMDEPEVEVKIPIEAYKAIESHEHQGASLTVADKKVADLNQNLNTTLKRGKQKKAHLQQPEARPEKKLGPSNRKRNTSDGQQSPTAKKRKVAGADLQLPRKRKASGDEEPKEQKKFKTAVDDDEEDEPMPDTKGSRPHVPVTTTRPGATSGLFASLFPNRKPIASKCKATSELVDPSQLTKRPSGISAFDTLKEKNAAIGLAPKATGQIKERQKTTNASEKTKPETAAKDVPSKPDVPVQSKPKPKEATTDVSSKPTTGSKPKPEDDAKDKAIKVARLVDNLPSKAPVADDSAKVAPSKPAVLTDSKTKANGAQSGVNKGAKGDSCSSHDESLGRLYDKKTPNAMPKGLSNFSLACFGNAPMQCLSGVAELVEHYQEQADNTIVEIADLVKQHPDFDRPGKGSRNINKLRNEVKSLLTIHEDLISVGAYFGEVVKNLCANGENTVVSPYVFLQAYGHIVKDATHSLNGDTSQAAWHFLTELLTRLDLEATMGADKGHGPLSLVKDLFNVTTATKLKCTKCTAKHDVSTEDHYNFNVALPVSETSKSLQGLLNGAKTSKILPDYKCNGEDGCNQIGVTREEFGVQEASKYLIVHANRIDHKLDKRGKMRSFKVHTKIDFPKDKLNLSTVFGVGPQSDGTKYEVFGVVEHLGEESTDGHYVALRKVNGTWWLCDDKKVTRVADKDLTKHCSGQLFFLKRVA